MSKYHERKLYTKNVLSRRNSKIPKTKVYYLTGVCVAIVTLLLTSTKVSQVNNMSKSQCCPLYCHVGWRRAPHRWRPHFGPFSKNKSPKTKCVKIIQQKFLYLYLYLHLKRIMEPGTAEGGHLILKVRSPVSILNKSPHLTFSGTVTSYCLSFP